MQPWKKTAAVTLCLLAATAAPAWAAAEPAPTAVAPAGGVQSTVSEPAPILIYAPASPVTATLPAPVEAKRTLPAAVAVNGRAVTFDQQPVMTAGVLMVPLRFVVEAAGGTVAWDGAARSVTVRLADRTAIFEIGQGSAEMNQDGVRYFQRNMIRMAAAPVLMSDRTLVSADALTAILGLMEKDPASATLDLIAPQARRESADMSGTIKQVEAGRILLEGGAMSSGEPALVWVSVNDTTPITVEEEGQERTGTVADLKAGLRADVRFAGPLLTSYPGQGAAESIRLYK